ncbi:MAG: chromosomal replication initiator protein DnaA [Verrucomicrobiales bacterium]|nr:chromosomal replication initiator protein DnaA [Verrucomicrobiales bacterium]
MQSPCQKLWFDLRRVLRGMVTPEIFNLWFASLKAKQLTESELTIEAGNDFHELWLTNNYQTLLQDILKHVSGRQIQVRFLAADRNGATVEPPVPTAPVATLPPRPRVRPPEAGPMPGDLNPHYSFDTFVVGNNSSFAHAAALAVAQSPGKSWNPLFIYGGTGLGKTHLLHAVGQTVSRERRNARVLYVTTERFTNEFIEGIQNNDLNRFRRKYRHLDLLLIDDIQFLQKKDRIQEEFFHTFNALHEAHRQIVLASDRPVGAIEDLEQRLVSRFEWGLITDLQPPDVETRMAIVRKKQRQYNVDLPAPVVEFLAERFRSNVRRLEGALAKLGATITLAKRNVGDITLDFAERTLRELLLEESRHVVTIDMIQRAVSSHYDIRLADMTSRRRPEHIAFARQVAMFLTRELTSLSLSAIGEAYGGRDHGTVLHACRLVGGRMEVDPHVKQTIDLLHRQLQT